MALSLFSITWIFTISTEVQLTFDHHSSFFGSFLNIKVKNKKPTRSIVIFLDVIFTFLAVSTFKGTYLTPKFL